MYNSAENYGYIMAQLYQSFVKWAEQKREYPAKVSMRSGHPIMHAVKFLGERGQIKNNEWSEVWLNRNSLEFDNDTKLVDKYITQEKLNKPFSLVDNGYVGSITSHLKKRHLNNDMQTIFLLGLKEFRGKTNTAFIREKEFDKAFSSDKTILPSLNLHDLIEEMPQWTASYNAENFKEKSEKVILTLEKKNTININRFKSYHVGMEKGFQDCFEAVKTDDKTQFENYIKQLLEIDMIGLWCLLSPESVNALTFASCDIRQSSQNLTQCKENIQQIYQKG